MIVLNALVASFLFLYSAAGAAEGRLVIADFSTGVNEKGVPQGWQLKEKSGKADYAVVKDGDLNAVRFRSANTSFSLQKEVLVDLKQFPILTWKWKVTKLPVGGDFRRSKTDDQAAQLFLAFSKTRAMVYIWDTTVPQGTMGNASAPFFMSIKAIVVRSGAADTGKWLTEVRNVYDDYKKLFGDEPTEVEGVRLQINSQHTETSAESYFADVVFMKQ
ncbi:MAG TPA: DUF3047 domain-containing protein [Nitrospirota bacterium]|nr:DUF3047 domain-containing protein [Nitrospirota bacterium]